MSLVPINDPDHSFEPESVHESYDAFGIVGTTNAPPEEAILEVPGILGGDSPLLHQFLENDGIVHYVLLSFDDYNSFVTEEGFPSIESKNMGIVFILQEPFESLSSLPIELRYD